MRTNMHYETDPLKRLERFMLTRAAVIAAIVDRRRERSAPPSRPDGLFTREEVDKLLRTLADDLGATVMDAACRTAGTLESLLALQPERIEELHRTMLRVSELAAPWGPAWRWESIAKALGCSADEIKE